MHRTGLIFGMMFSLALASGACSRTAEERADTSDADLGDELTVTGCLTASPGNDAFVVTAARTALTSGALHSGSGETPTYTYELTGDVGQVTEHVGRQVEVTGRLDKDRDDEVEVDNEDETKLPARQSGNDTVTPAIEMETEMDIKVRRLHVASVKPTGQPCVTGGR